MTEALMQSRPVAAGKLRMETIRDVKRWDAIRCQWQHLHAQAHASPTLDYDWLRIWWDVYGVAYARRGEGPLILTAWEGDSLAAALPLYIRRPRVWGGPRVAGFIGTGEREAEEICPDYLDVLCNPELPSAGKLLLEQACEEYAALYDRLDLLDLSDAGLAANWAREGMVRRDVEVSPRGACPIADLSGGMDAYLARLSSNERQHIRRLLRQAESLGVQFEVGAAAQFNEFFDELVELHQERWEGAGEEGCFAAPRFTAFHRRLASQWISQGKAMLSRLRLDGRTVAVKYGFLHDGKYDFYQSGVRQDADPRLKSPGVVSFALLMDYLAAQGVASFDFLRGSSNYKQRLATCTQPLVQMRFTRWTWRTQMACVASVARRCGGKIRRGMRSLLRSPAKGGK